MPGADGPSQPGRSESGAPEARASGAAGGGWRRRDHTRGPLLLSLAVLALPMLATSLSGLSFQMGDLELVSGLGEEATTAVVVTNQSLRQILFMLVMGASFGAQGLIARAVGRGAGDRADHVAGQTVSMGLIFSSLVAALGVPFARPLLALMHVSPGVLEVGVPYVQLLLLLNFGFVFIALFNAILSGAGDTTTPLLISVIQTVIALGAEWCLIYGHFGLPALGIRGVMLGLAVAQLGSMLLIARVLFGGRARVHIRLRHMRPDSVVMRRILLLAWPPALQMLGGFLVTVFFIRLMGDLGPKAQTAYAIGLRLGMIGPMLGFPLAGAVGTLVGQALGAKDTARAWRALRVGLATAVALMWPLAIALFLFRIPLLALFTQDPEVLSIGARLLAWQAASFALLALFFVFFRALQGAGDVVVPMLVSLATSLLVSLPLGIRLAKSMGPDGIFVAQFTGLALVTLSTGLWIGSGRWIHARRPSASAQGSA